MNIDDALLAEAGEYTGQTEKTALVRMGLEALIEREAARRLPGVGRDNAGLDCASAPAGGTGEQVDAGLTGTIIGCAMAVHRALGPGFLESVYQNALVHELTKAGLVSECGKGIKVRYDRVIVGNFIADILVGGSILVENKAVQTLVPAHEVQLVNYLTATSIETGLLLNFGSERLQYKRKSRTYRPRRASEQIF